MSFDITTTTLPRQPHDHPLPAVIRVLNAPATPSEFSLTEGSCTIGAGRKANILVRDDALSRLHAEFTLRPEGVELRDLGSRNGSYYLGQRVECIVLGLGSRVTLGRVEVAIETDPSTFEVDRDAARTSYGDLVGASPAMRQLFELLSRIEGTLVAVLIEGESGTGKELVARAVHRYSGVSEGPFVAVNCGAMDRALARSELFGHVKGSFTGAHRDMPGAFEAADGGTLLLDEIGELPTDVQPMLLRALETSSVVRVGESRERRVKVRLIASTNRDLAEQARTGSFREDLFYRLNVIRCCVPPLRARPGDVELLARHFAAQLGIHELPGEVLRSLHGRSWPGNVRELQNALQSYAALGRLCDAPLGEPGDFDPMLRRTIDVARPYAPQKEQLIRNFMRTYLSLLLDHTGNNQSEAARISGLERSYLSKTAARLGLLRRPPAR